MLGRKKMRLNENIEILTKEAISLLKALIETPSFSSEEDKTAVLVRIGLQNDIPFERENNNIWAFNKHLTQNLLYFKFAPRYSKTNQALPKIHLKQY
jgi:hypothetical protein